MIGIFKLIYFTHTFYSYSMNVIFIETLVIRMFLFILNTLLMLISIVGTSVIILWCFSFISIELLIKTHPIYGPWPGLLSLPLTSLDFGKPFNLALRHGDDSTGGYG